MCEASSFKSAAGVKTIHLSEAVGSVLAHDITEIRQGEFKGPAFRKGHIIREEDICHLQRLRCGTSDFLEAGVKGLSFSGCSKQKGSPKPAPTGS